MLDRAQAVAKAGVAGLAIDGHVFNVLAFGVQTHQLTTFGVVVFDDQVDGAFGGVVDAHLQVVARALDAHVLGGQVGAFVEQLDAAAAWVVKEVDNLGVEHLGAGLGGAAVKLDDVFGFHDFLGIK